MNTGQRLDIELILLLEIASLRLASIVTLLLSELLWYCLQFDFRTYSSDLIYIEDQLRM